MADKDLKLVVKADDQASRVFKEAKKAVQDLGTAEEDARTNAQKLADEMKATADKIDAELGDAKAAVDALGIALGDEMVGKITSAGGSVDGLVGKFKAAGLTYDEIRGDADQLAEAVRRLGEIGKVAGDDVQAGALQAEAGLSRVHSESDQSRSVLANMVGNSAQDLGELGGVAGSAGVALGQVAEYAADGNLSLSGLTKLAGPMIGLGLAVKGVSSLLEAMNQHAKDVARQTEVLVGVQEKLADAQYETAAASLIEEYSGTLDVIEQYGFGVKDLLAHLRGEIDLSEQVKIKAIEQGASMSELTFIMTNLTRNLGESTESWDAATTSIEKNTRRTDEFVDAVKPASEATADMSHETEVYAAKADAAEAATRELNDEYKRLTGELTAAEAWLGVETAIDDYKAKIDDATLSNREKQRAIIDLKQELIGYLSSLEGVPKEKQTDILALIDQGKFDEAEAALQYLGRPRDVQFRSGVTGGALPTVPKFADGGVMPGPTGEHNLAWVAGGETILPTHKPGFSVGGGAPTMVFVGIDRYVQQSVRAAWNARERVSRYGSRIAR